VQYSKLHEMQEISHLPGSDSNTTPSNGVYEEIKGLSQPNASSDSDGSLQDNPLYGKYLT